MKKRMLSAGLALCLILGLSLPAGAVSNGSPTFSDVPTTHWAYTAIEEMADRGVVSGIGNGKFAPDQDVTPSQFALMLGQLIYPDELDAMPAGYNWWVNAADLLMDKGVFENTTARMYYQKGIWDEEIMNAPMNRYDMAQMMYGILKAEGVDMPSESELKATASKIADYAQIPDQYACLTGSDCICKDDLRCVFLPFLFQLLTLLTLGL